MSNDVKEFLWDMVFKPKGSENDQVVKIQVTLTKGCHRAIKQFAALRGMTMSQVFYLSARYHLHREALSDSLVRMMMEREGIPLDEEIFAQWRAHLETQANLDEVFTPRPTEAL